MRIKLMCLSIMMASHPIYANYPALVGNIAARDLHFKGGGWLGHAGLASANHHLMKPDIVLEAMDTMPHIRQVTVEQFKAVTSYWGSRGGILKPGSYDQFTVANRIVRQYYLCPDYSYTWQWRTGEAGGNSKPITCALFRCDTLINYAYAFNNHFLPTYNTRWTTPIGVWNSFPIDTDLLIPEHPINHQNNLLTINETVDSINESNLKELTPEKFYQMLQNSEDITQDQINRIWNLFSSNDANEQVKILFYNFLASQKVSILSDDVIERAKNEHGSTRHQLLLILQTIYQNKLAKNDSSELTPIVNYFKKLQDEVLNQDDAGIIYRGLAVLAPMSSNKKKQGLINMDKIHVDVFSLKSDRANELKYVKDIINNLEHPDDSLVITATYQYITELLINSDLKFFSSKSKSLFRTYLNSKNIMEEGYSMFYISAYIEFKAALNAKNKDEIPALSIGYMSGFSSDMKKLIPYGFSDFTQKKLSIHK